jgi:predicted nucleic acid-binding protein
LIFADTSFLIAGTDERDSHHDAALRLFEEVADRRIMTTNHVLGETWTWLRRKRWHALAVEFLDSIGGEGHHIEVAHLSEELEDEALDWLRRHDEREYSFVDATSFAYMRARRITEALAFDGDFAAAGFTELRP